MPVVMASMLTATSEPRTFAGTSSAMYMGEMNEAMPMPMPLATRGADQPADRRCESRADRAQGEDDAGEDDHPATPEPAGQGATGAGTEHGTDQDGADDDLFHRRREGKLAFDKQDGARNDARVIAEEQTA